MTVNIEHLLDCAAIDSLTHQETIQLCDHIKSQAAEIAEAKGQVEHLDRQNNALREAMARLIRGYVNTLEAGRDRITFLGGDCDPVDVMEACDPWLKDARAALSGEPT